MEIFITGGTGLLGDKLLKKLSIDEEISKMYILVRNQKKAYESLKKLINIEKIELLTGDVSCSDFALTAEEISKMSNISRFYHLAACVHLGDAEKVKYLLQKININGTMNAINLVDSMPNLQDFIYISSAYACGNYPEKVPEDWLKASTYRNFYEESKWQCEQLIKSRLSGGKVNFSIIRPSILLDNANNGRISNHTIYLFSAIIKKHLESNERIRLCANAGSCLNFVFTEDLIEFILNINYSEESKVFNFVNESNISINELLETIKSGLNQAKITILEHNLSNEMSLTEKTLNKTLSPFAPYLHMRQLEWETVNKNAIITNSVMKGKKEVLENIKSYCEMLN